MWSEFAWLGASVVLWGSTFVPTKEFPVGDGFYYQWIMALGIWVVGLITNMTLDSPPLHPIPMIGGILWTTGNLMTVPIVRMIGLGLGMLLWGTMCMVVGWASGKFGLFGLQPQAVSWPLLNYVGVGVAILSGFIFMLVRPTTSNHQEESNQEREAKGENDPLLPTKSRSSMKSSASKAATPLELRRHKREESEMANFGLMLHEDCENQNGVAMKTSEQDLRTVYGMRTIPEENSKGQANVRSGLRQRFLHFVHMDDHEDFRHMMMHYFHIDALSLPNAEEMTRHCLPITLFHLDSMPPLQKRVLGVTLALLAGALYGVAFNPTQWLIDNNPDGPQQAIFYFYSHISGILIASTGYFIIYCILSRNKPQVFAQVTLPALISGFMWSVAQLGYFKSTSGLGMVVTTPITTIGPGVVASLWSVFVFREIQGRQNFAVLVLAIVVSTAAILMIAFSF